MIAEERFWSKVERLGDNYCWIWQGTKMKNGYGQLRVGSKRDGSRRMELVHRFAYRHFKEPIPYSFQINHLCRNRACVNPNHLEALSAVEHYKQVRDHSKAVAATRRRQNAKTHCPYGHHYSKENTYIDTNGWRSCRTCNNRGRPQKLHFHN